MTYQSSATEEDKS